MLTHNLPLLALKPFGDELFLSFMLLALIGPPAVYWVRSRHWQFGLRTFMCAAFLCTLLCAFSARDLRRIDDLALGFSQEPIWWVRHLLLPPAIVAVISTCASAFAFRKTRGAGAGRQDTEERRRMKSDAPDQDQQRDTPET